MSESNSTPCPRFLGHWENPNRLKKEFGLAEFYFVSASDYQLHCGDGADLNAKSSILVVEKSPRLKMPASSVDQNV